MKSTTVDEFMQLVAPLSTEMKLEILSELSASLKMEFSSQKDDKLKLLRELSGSWSDTDDDLAEQILNSRTVSDRNISFD